MPALESALLAKLIGPLALLFWGTATAGVMNVSAQVFTGHSLLAQANLSENTQLGIAGIGFGACAFLGKIILEYHKQMIADKDKQLDDLHVRIRELEASRDAQSKAIFDNSRESRRPEPLN